MLNRLVLKMISCFLLVGPLHAANKNEYKIDPNHSSVTWHISHFGFSDFSGKWILNGTFEFDPQAPEKSKTHATVDIDTIITGAPELNKHLKSKLFFEVEKFPHATFVSDNVTVVNNEITEVSGNLTIHGITKPVTFKTKQNKIGPNPVNDRFTVGFSGKTTLKRSDFGIVTLLPQLTDDVELNVELEGFQENVS